MRSTRPIDPPHEPHGPASVNQGVYIIAELSTKKQQTLTISLSSACNRQIRPQLFRFFVSHSACPLSLSLRLDIRRDRQIERKWCEVGICDDHVAGLLCWVAASRMRWALLSSVFVKRIPIQISPQRACRSSDKKKTISKLLGAHAAKSWLPGPPSGRGTLGPPCIRCGTLFRNVGPPMWVKNPRPPPWWRCGTSVQNRGPPNSLVWNLETLGPPCIRCGTLCCWDWPCEAVQLGGSLRFWVASMSTLLHRCVLLCRSVATVP